MPEIDAELVERTIRWCAEAGRQTTPAQVRAALGALGWDELLAVRALLADPPPLRPLGPFALADVARGAPADVAAERERAGRYGRALSEAGGEAAPAVAPPPAARPRRGARARPGFVIRKATDRPAAAAPAASSPPLLDALLLEEGRAVLARLLRKHGGRRARLVEALARGWRRADGGEIGNVDLDALLVHHGQARAFETRERDELLHALRAAGGLRAKAAAALGLDAEALDAALARLGATAEAERVREQRRRELRGRGTLTQRAHLVLADGARLADLGLLDEFLADLRARLPEHLRALSGATGPAAERVGRSLSLDAAGVARLAEATGLALQPAAPPERADRRAPAKRPRPPAKRTGPPAKRGPPRPRARKP
jgi:hypothetical protein